MNCSCVKPQGVGYLGNTDYLVYWEYNISFAIVRRNGCVGITVQLIERLNRISILLIPEKLFDAIGFSRVLSTLRSGYHQLSLLTGDRVKTAFWEVDHDGKDQL